MSHGNSSGGKRRIAFSRVVGTASRQAHVALPEGTFEREMGQEGFFGPASFFYHRHPPTGWQDFCGPLKPRAFDLNRLNRAELSPWGAHEVLHNRRCRVRLWRCSASMPHLVRNADGDDLLFIHAGSADLFCDFGRLSIATGDYVLIPRGTMWRLECAAPVTMLLVEATGGHYWLPERGMVGAHAIFDPAMLDVPDIDERFVQQQGDREWSVHIKRHGQISTVSFPFNPLDAIGWHGDLSVCRINIKDLRPLSSHRYHLPPSAHTTFVADGFVVCTFVPRPFESDPQAIKVPFYHNNDDFDEAVFYHAGDFFSRDHIGPGMLTLHPSGFTHGPHPKAATRMYVQPKPATDEYAVMVDSRDAFEVSEAAGSVEWLDYVDSWKAVSP